MGAGIDPPLALRRRDRTQHISLIQIKPANGFEPMTFALQKRCSTAELSRHGLHRTGACLAIQNRLSVPNQPKNQLESVATTALAERSADVALNGAVTDHQSLGDGSVIEAFKQHLHNLLFGRSEGTEGARFQA